MCTVPNDKNLDSSIRGAHVQLNGIIDIKCAQGFRPRNAVTTNRCNFNGLWDNGWDNPICDGKVNYFHIYLTLENPLCHVLQYVVRLYNQNYKKKAI